jgi:hypothetical protein
LCAAAAAGCSKSGNPATPTVTPTAIALSASSDLMLVGATQTFTASVSFSDGTTRAGSVTWSTDNTAIARVSASGVVEGIGPGIATIAAESQGVRGTKTVRVVPVFSGGWAGRWQHVSCVDVMLPPGFSRCASYIMGDSSALALTLAQDRDAVQGTLNLSGVLMIVSGTIAVDGTLSMSGERPNTGDYVSSWRSTVVGTSMEGTFDWGYTSPLDQSGHRLSDRLLNVVRQ